MTFGAPEWFWALLAAPALLALFVRNERRNSALVERVVASRLVPKLAGNVSHRLRRLRFALLSLGLVCLAIALAKPRLGYTFEEASRKGRDVIVAIDTSRSMLANDLPPNRLTRAKMAAQDLIDQLRGDRVGLVAFAGGAFLQAPLTIDYSAVLNALNELDTEIIPRGGTNIAQAIEIAADAFGKGESESRAIVLFTDGEELDADAVKVAKKYARQITIFTVGVGSREGAIIPVPKEGGGTDFVRDSSGEVVRSQLDESRLEEIADATGGFYLNLANGPADMKRIVTTGLGKMAEQQIDARMARRPIERYQWPLGAGLILLAATVFINDRRRSRRRGGVSPLGQTALAAAALTAFASESHGANPGVKLYHEKDYAQSLERFKRQLGLQPESQSLHYDAGTAAYQLGKYDEALQSFSQALTSPDPSLRASSEYNLGNTLYQRGAKQKEREPKIKEWKSAIEHYEQALAIEPGNEDAKYNRDLVRKLIEDLEKQQQEQKNQDKKDKKDKDQQQDKKDQDKSKEDRKDQKKKDKDSGKKQDESKSGKGDEDKEKKEPGDGKGEPKEGDSNRERNPQEGGEPQQQGNPDGSQTPGPVPTPSNRDRSGEMKAQQDQSQGEPQEAQAAAPVEDGKMNEQQAAALLRSLQGEDAQVPLLQPRQSSPVLKDW